MRLILLALLLGAAAGASAQRTTIKVDEAASHIGDSVRICATVRSSRYYVQVQGKPTVFYFGKPYPNHQLSVVIWEKDRKNFPKPVELLYGDGALCFYGKLTLVDGRPQLEVTTPDQIGLQEEGDQ
ncbi:hypothetical protein [Flaviaesturariibacter terrae]